MSTVEAKKVARKYAKALKKSRVGFSHLYLFGSYARGKATATSDIDIALILKELPSKKAYLNKKMKLWEIASEVDTRIEPIILGKKDFTEKATALAHEVNTKGIRIL